MPGNPPVDVQEYGQSIWLDYIHRQDLNNGALQRRVDEDGVLGITSNPAIFQKAIGESSTYDEGINHLLDLEAPDIYERLAVEDIQQAADLFRAVYDRTKGRDGYVSLEVSPLIASSTEKTIAEARRLYDTVGRPNLMIKIPATPEGIPAIEATIADGINVNITLIFSIENYLEVMEAYLRGLEKRQASGQPVSGIASVASFFISRIDTAVDRILENNIRVAQVHGDTGRIAANRRLLGQAAIANAKLAYRAFQRIFAGPRWEKLRTAGAQVQRPLWASTSSKNPSYKDTIYIDNLIGRDTVNTVPPATLDAFKDHGLVSESLLREVDDALAPEDVMDKLTELGVDMAQVTQRLQIDGVEAFIEAFEKLIEQIAAKRTTLRTGFMDRQLSALGIYADDFKHTLTELDKKLVNARIWSRDGSLWKNHGPTIEKIRNRLGWLDVLKTIDIDRLKALKASMQGSAVRHVVLLGMGGSSLAPEVLFRTFGQQAGFPALTVLDSTDPARIRAVEASIDLASTLFIVASKSGTTTETDAFCRYFYERTGQNGQQFIAITDGGGALEKLAHANHFRDIFINPTDIGGRYSALSYFGMVPAALLGLDLDRLWQSASNMIDGCGETVTASNHPGLYLGALIGAMARHGRDKVTIHTTQSLRSFGDWAEQLVAESLGKDGKGVVPVVGATVGRPHDYVSDRLFIYLRLDDDADVEEMDAGIRALREAGHPRLTLRLPDIYALASEFFRWEFATAVAGVVLAVNPFDEPNVTEAKEATRQLLAHYEAHGVLPDIKPTISGEHARLYSNERTLAPLREMCRSHGYDDASRTEMLAAQIAASEAGDYFAILAYFTPDEHTGPLLSEIRRRLRHVSKRAVTVGWGPRYLHSTGQLHKGGPNNGIFFQITARRSEDLDIPGIPYSFGTLFDAQAAGDLQALFSHNRRALRLHIEGDIVEGLQKLLAAVEFVENRKF